MTLEARVGDPHLAKRLERSIAGEVRFDPFSRGLYSTDASIYQIEPVGVVIPRTKDDVLKTIHIAHDEGVPVLARGAGTSQAGQAVGRAIVVDTSKYLTKVLAVDPSHGTAIVEPGVVLDHLNAVLATEGLMFPVDVATSNRATIGGMAGNNSSGARSIRYGLMADNVLRIAAVLGGGDEIQFGMVPASLHDPFFADVPPLYRDIVHQVRSIYVREQDELERRVPAVLRHVAGYNLHRIDESGHNMAELLIGSEGTLGFFTEIELQLAPLSPSRVLGVCHFPHLHAAMDATRHIVALDPTAVELVDRSLLDVAALNPAFGASLQRFVRGKPGALLLVEFSGSDGDETSRDLARLEELMAELGLPGGVVRAEEAGFQDEIWAVRKAGLNIVMSKRSAKKPVSFIEDCAIPLEHLATYTDRLTDVFEQAGAEATWYAHASVGCLHVRPALDLKDPDDVALMRSIAEDAHAIVAELGGSYSGEHGDGIVRSEFLASMMGDRLARAFEEVKELFDPEGLFNPGKIVSAPRMDDRSLFRYSPDYRLEDGNTVLDWSLWAGFGGAVEMCNNNGACRKRSPGAMCPSFRVTDDEQHVTRGRANALRLALSGRLGPDALESDEMYGTMELCVGCKACRAECPTGVDMARMKIEVLHARMLARGVGLRDRIVAHLPRYAPLVSRLALLVDLGTRLPGSRALGERVLGIAARRDLPRWHRKPFRPVLHDDASGQEVVLFADTFNTYFEPDNLRAAVRVLRAAGYRVVVPRALTGRTTLCCGRTFLNAGMVDHAVREMRRMVRTLKPYAERGVSILGLEPSCLLTFRDELPVLLPDEDALKIAESSLLFEEFMVREREAGSWPLELAADESVLVHVHCHQKALGAARSVSAALETVRGVEVETFDSTCCGMAGSFGYESEHYDVSLAIGELDVLPAVRSAAADTVIVADGTSCRAQIAHGTGREAVHAVRVLDSALNEMGQKGQ